MEKYKEFMQDVRRIRGLKTVRFEYDGFMDNLIVHFTQKQFSVIDNEESKMWEHFSDLLTDYDYEHDFGLYQITVWEK